MELVKGNRHRHGEADLPTNLRRLSSGLESSQSLRTTPSSSEGGGWGSHSMAVQGPQLFERYTEVGLSGVVPAHQKLFKGRDTAIECDPDDTQNCDAGEREIGLLAR